MPTPRTPVVPTRVRRAIDASTIDESGVPILIQVPDRTSAGHDSQTIDRLAKSAGGIRGLHFQAVTSARQFAIRSARRTAQFLMTHPRLVAATTLFVVLQLAIMALLRENRQQPTAGASHVAQHKQRGAECSPTTEAPLWLAGAHPSDDGTGKALPKPAEEFLAVPRVEIGEVRADIATQTIPAPLQHGASEQAPPWGQRGVERVARAPQTAGGMIAPPPRYEHRPDEAVTPPAAPSPVARIGAGIQPAPLGGRP
jgi:hypothetical protein